MPFLPNSEIEIINDKVERGAIRHALFDFDGTISLIREGWQQVMIPMMVEILMQTPRHESEAELTAIVAEFVDRTTGQQSIYQMIQLCEEIAKRGGEPLDPVAYKHKYLKLLRARFEHRIAGLKDGSISQEAMLVPGSLEMLRSLEERQVACYLASGTDKVYVEDEAAALGITSYFRGGVYGAVDDYKTYSKAMVIDRILRTHGIRGAELVVFGDGYVEIEDAKRVGGIAVGLATDEIRLASVNAWKRNRLLQAGADIIVPHFRESVRLVAYLFGEE